MIRYMLDTNTCIYLIKHHPPEVREKLGTISVGEIGVSSIAIAELWYGITESTKRKHNEGALNDFLDYVTVLDWPMKAAPQYGFVRSHLKKRGTPIGAMDLLIAAHAIALNTVLVTNNMREFRRVPRLKLENWVRR